MSAPLTPEEFTAAAVALAKACGEVMPDGCTALIVLVTPSGDLARVSLPRLSPSAVVSLLQYALRKSTGPADGEGVAAVPVLPKGTRH